MLATLLLALLTACAVRLGGYSPRPFTTLAIRAGSDATPEEVAALVSEQSPQLALIAADKDTAWFNRLATATGMELSGPGRTGDQGLAFLTNLLILGDTSIVLLVPSGGRIHMHDALFEIEEDRNLDLMMIDVVGVQNLRDAARTLLSYIATDVGNNVPIVLAVSGPPVREADDSVALLIRAALSNARDCATDSGGEGWTGDVAGLHLLYGPPARMACESARALPAEGSIQAQLIAR